jgi:hypothetical protein
MTAVAAPSIAPAALVPIPSDPIFAAIEAHRQADAENDEAGNANGLLPVRLTPA